MFGWCSGWGGPWEMKDQDWTLTLALTHSICPKIVAKIVSCLFYQIFALRWLYDVNNSLSVVLNKGLWFSKRPVLTRDQPCRMFKRVALKIRFYLYHIPYRKNVGESRAGLRGMWGCGAVTTQPPLANPALWVGWPFRISWLGSMGLTLSSCIHQSWDTSCSSKERVWLWLRKFPERADSVISRGNASFGPEGGLGWVRGPGLNRLL